VKGSVEKVIAGQNPGACARAAHKEWYRELFQPCVTAGLIEPGALAGYRNIPVHLRASRCVPPRWEAVRDAMPVFFDLLEKETERRHGPCTHQYTLRGRANRCCPR
jgi:hypothetical protein